MISSLRSMSCRSCCFLTMTIRWLRSLVYGHGKAVWPEYMGIIRSTFLIDEEGYIVKEWSKVKVKNHVQSVLDAVMALKANT